jgi:three-Cys-motif partner protein
MLSAKIISTGWADMTNSEGFFDEQLDQSRVKAELIEKYFTAWSTVMKSQVDRIAYIDLFAGPGRYNSGAASVPLLILERALGSDFLKKSLVTIFNDKDSNNTQNLETEIGKLPNIGSMTHQPQVMNSEVGDNIVQTFEKMKLIPTFFFVDPWGYKGLSLKLINSVLKDWGCDCVFFFNYSRINAGLNNPIVKTHMDALFGGERAEKLRARLANLTPAMRELAIVEELTNAIQEMGGSYVLPFTFKRENGSRTSHHLFFISKHVLGYKIMKGIMANASSNKIEGVASFAYSPAPKEMPLLFEFARPLTELGEMLLDGFAGRTMTRAQVFDEHHVGRPFIEANYRDILLKLEAAGSITVDPPASKRRPYKGQPSLPEAAKITFPKR